MSSTTASLSPETRFRDVIGVLEAARATGAKRMQREKVITRLEGISPTPNTWTGYENWAAYIDAAVAWGCVRSIGEKGRLALP